MGAREDFEQAVRRGDFVGAAAVWTKADLEASPSLDAFQSKLRASLEDRKVTIGRTLVGADGEYEYLGDAGQNGARLAFVPNAGSLDQIEFIADVDALQAHFGRSNTSPTDKEAVAAFFAMSERANERGRSVGDSVDISRGVNAVDGGDQAELLRNFENERFRKELPVLSDALLEGRLDVVQALINSKADVNEYAKRPAAERGMAPIHFAQTPEAIRMLAKAGANVNAPYKDVDHAWGMRGETLLHTLALTGDSRDLLSIDALLESGADQSLPFGQEYKYGNDSNVGMNEQVVRGDTTLSARLVVLREKAKQEERELDELLSSPTQGPKTQLEQDGTLRDDNAQPLSPTDSLRQLLAGHGDSLERIDVAVSHASKTFVNDRVYVGVLRDFGPAPYLHDKDNTQSYFVTYQAPNGKEETVWGKDLASAVQAEGLQPGAEFVLAFQGSKPVTVTVKVRDAEGKLTGEVTEAPAVRNEWLATSVARLRAEAAELGPVEPAQEAPVDAIDADQEAKQERIASEGAKELVDATRIALNASYADDSHARSIENERAHRLEEQAYKKLASVDVERAQALVALERGSVIKDGQLHSSIRFEAEKHQATVAQTGIEAKLEGEPAQIRVEQKVADVEPARESKTQSEDAIQGVPRAKVVLASDRNVAEDAIVRVTKDGEKGKDADNAAAGKEPLTTLLNGRFILRENGEYFRITEGVESKRVALVDEETKIRFVDKQMDTFQAAIELAKHKDWEAILVTGSEKFRAEAWHHARMAGLEVIGYEPTEKDLASLKAAQENEVKPKAGQQLGSPLATSNADVAHVKSLAEINKLVLDAGYGARPAALDNSKNDGKIIFESDKHFAQDTGRKVATIHDKANFDRLALRAAIEVGGSMKVQYENGRATIESKKDRSQARGR
jgi:hypothetical protein